MKREVVPMLDDHMVRSAANLYHVPEESWYMGKVSLVCYKCQQVWPCETRLELRRLNLPED